jgi:hypothetical protein
VTRATAFALSAAAGLCSLAFASDAHALGPVDIEVGARAGYATNPSNGSLNPLGVGVGGRAGVSFLGGVYLGGSAMYYLGGSSTGVNTTDTTNSAMPTHSTYTLTTTTLMVGGEVGYGLKVLDLLTIRPQMGAGNATFSTSAAGSTTSQNNLYLEPGVTALVGFGLLYAGADANVLFFPGADESLAAFSLHAQVGVRF